MEIKNKQDLTRKDISELLASIGKPGEKRTEKIQAVADLSKQNFQGHPLESSLESYGEY